MAADLQIFGERLRKLRQQRGLTQAELARLVPVSDGLISRWERAYQGQGRIWKPDRQTFLRLIEIFCEGLDAAESRALSELVGYVLTQAELQALFPAVKDDGAPSRGHKPQALSPEDSQSAGNMAQSVSTGAPAAPLSSPSQERFVAREEEMARLHEHLSAALTGHGRVVFVQGAAGTGKSLLLRAFAQDALTRHPGLIVLDASCTAYAGYGPPYMPFREILNVLLGHATTEWASGTIRHLQQSRLANLLPHAIELLANRCRDLVETFVPAAALVERVRELHTAGLLSTDQVAAYADAFALAAARSDSEQRNLFEHYAVLLHLLSQQQPLLLLIDDLHWTDPISVSLLFHLGRRLQGKRILIAGAYRSSDLTVGLHGTEHPLVPVVHEMRRRYGAIMVDLDHSSGRRFVDAYIDSEPNQLGQPFREQLWQRTRGHALFTAEMIRGMQARQEIFKDAEEFWVEGRIDWENMPARIEGLIAEQINRLPARLGEVLEAASVQGETFMAEVIAQVLGLDERQLLRCLTVDLGKHHRLVVEEGVQRIGTQRLSQFRFRHVLFQSYLVHSLGAVERAYLHERVAAVLEALCQADVEPFAEQLAHHFLAADMPDKAARYLLPTAKRALRLAAHEESMRDLRRGLALLERVPPSTERDRTELEFLVTLGTSLIATKGFGVPEVGEVYRKALQLCAQTDDTSLHAVILFNLWIFHVTRADHTSARDNAEQLMALAEQAQDTALLLQAHHALWTMSLYAGDFSTARVHTEQGIELYRTDRHHPLTFQFGGHDPGVCCRIFAAYALWYLGYPDRSLKRIQEAVDLARTVEHAYSLAMALTLGAEIHLLRREGEPALAHLDEARPLAETHAFAGWLELGAIFRGWALAELGEPERGIMEMLQGLDANRAQVGEETGLHCFAQLAAAHGKAHAPDEGLALLDAALATEDKNKLRHWHQWQSELYRLQGELRLMRAEEAVPAQDDAAAIRVDAGAIEESFQRAIDIARQQEAKLPELRAVTSLSRFWVKQGRLEPAYTLLDRTYGWFTEGFDTADLVEARRLRETLAAPSSPATPLD